MNNSFCLSSSTSPNSINISTGSKTATTGVWWRVLNPLNPPPSFRWWMWLYLRMSVFYLLPFCLSSARPLALSRSLRVLRFHTHPQLLVPEQQFASSFIELQPVNLRVVADGSQIVACSQVHWGVRRERKQESDWQRSNISDKNGPLIQD